MNRLTYCLAALLLASGCGDQAGPPVAVSDVRIYAPLPGSTVSVAYLAITNNTAEPLVISEIASPQFSVAELHETTLSEDVYRMRPLPTLTIPPDSAVELREGAQHIMLMEPVGELALGDPITLFIRDLSGGELVVRSSLETRIRVEGN